MITEHWQADYFLDAKGMACPMPLLKLKQQLNRMQIGERVRVETTDIGSVRDFEAFCTQAGHGLLQQLEGKAESGSDEAVYGFLIEKNGVSAG